MAAVENELALETVGKTLKDAFFLLLYAINRLFPKGTGASIALARAFNQCEVDFNFGLSFSIFFVN